ncbi:CDP-diacylglycerol--serine O-phosphatidyltransferase [Iodidimonas nitroreducens]|uniref:CDP-diacylglycerol--serine O-phosphatidyltransferase n=1 Tax=Iodidimonas nitroreducens TaxID=1236968 RepID=A0A5A7N4Z7_9PROT|nr:CDP-diacylglycerol--serine O-phosphatidyltransferase [Iodidimonas nitroreducens]GAK34063.1 CDP-diacylglycerol--serine O-phosphatidyltransferase [alpha proteobacterium Q-1]GER02834.1 CDP-diacylglycerol--serine O-phosphatidyltransferase [Iodidimonas nitroreducens]
MRTPKKDMGRNVFTARMMAANVVTTLALCSGMTAIRFAIEGRFQLAVVFVIAAAVLDAMDGAVARLLKSTSRFGAELDSLSDVVAFGMAPAFLLYAWGLGDMGRFGWIVALAYGVSVALRLARYNAAIEDEDDPHRPLGYFTGVPAPAGAMLVLLPMLLDFAFESNLFQRSIVLVGYVGLIATLVVSRLPTFSLKQFRVRRDAMVPTLLLIALFAASVTVYRWAALSIVVILYLGSIPLALSIYRRKKHESVKSKASE